MRAFFLFLARQEGFKNFMLKFSFFRKTASRFVAGETLDDAVRVVRQVNLLGIHATLDLLGENTRSREDAQNATRQVLEMLDRVKSERLDCNVSVKLTQLGMDLDDDFCRNNLLQLVRKARDLDSFVRVDMEDSHYTQRTLDIVTRVHAELRNVGTVIQAYLYRSESDVRMLISKGVRVRLCKGAYLEPESVAFREKRDTDSNFVKLTKILLDSDIYHAIATHDEKMIDATRRHAEEKGIARDRFEFQMLHGIRRDLQAQLAKEGYNVRVYVPYGSRWYPYYMRRLAERPANVGFIIRSLFHK
jgi:proline dehydrogenase